MERYELKKSISAVKRQEISFKIEDLREGIYCLNEFVRDFTKGEYRLTLTGEKGNAMFNIDCLKKDSKYYVEFTYNDEDIACITISEKMETFFVEKIK